LGWFDPFGIDKRGQFAGVFEIYVHHVLDGMDRWYPHSVNARARIYGLNGQRDWVTGNVYLGQDTVGDFFEMNFRPKQGPFIWRVIDTMHVGSFTDTLEFPKLFKVTYPLQLMRHDSVSLSQGFQVLYESPGTDSVRILIQGDSFLAVAFDSAIKRLRTEPYHRSGAQPSTGSYWVSPSDLREFYAPGVAKIFVARQVSQVRRHHGRDFYYRVTVVSELATYTKL
jgi:hypothetical protein